MGKRQEMQQRIYDFIVESTRSHGYAPSVREICAAMGLRSPSTVHFHIKNLAALGYLEHNEGKGRAIVPKKGLGSARRAPVPDGGEPVPAKGEPAPVPPPAGRVPLVGNVAAGSPILAQECVEDYIAFDAGGREDEYFALRVRGESMLYAGILPGDLVVVHRQSQARSGEIVVALLEDEATVKTLSLRGGEIWLLPSNPDYQPIDGTGCSILGRVSAVIRYY